jgi:hypothetical protein
MSENMGRTLTFAGNTRSPHSSGDNDGNRSVGGESAQWWPLCGAPHNGHYVTFQHNLGYDVTICNGKRFKIICSQCGY